MTTERRTPPRTHTVTQKVEKALTGLRGALYVHVSHGRSGKIYRVEVSNKWKDDPELDPVFRALSDAITEAVHDAQSPRVYAFPPVTKWKAKEAMGGEAK